MKALAWSYPVVAMLGIIYWIILATPLRAIAPGDGGILIATGLAILGIALAQLIIWSGAGIREATINLVGKTKSYLAIAILSAFCSFSLYVLIDFYAGGP